MRWLPRFSILFAFVYVLLVPPFQSPDEPNHFFRAWQISEGHIFPEKQDARLGAMLPLSLLALRDSFGYLRQASHARITRAQWRQALQLPLSAEKRGFIDFANTAIYAPTAYVPQALAIAVLRPLGATPLQMLYGARFSNLLVWLLLTTAAIRLMPFLKNTLWAIALLPASLCMAASANADVFSNGLSWWLIACLMLAPERTVFWKKWLVVVAVSLNKLIAAPLALLGVISGRQRRQSIGLLVVGLLAAFMWGKIAQSSFIPFDAYNPAFRQTQTLNSGVDPAKQLAYVLEHPFSFVATSAQSFVRALPSLSAHFVGKFGWEKNYLPSGYIALLWLMLLALLMSEHNPLSLKQRGGMAALLLLYLFTFSLTIYMLWCAVGSKTLDNWQGRYFVAIAPVAAMAFAQGYWKRWRAVIERSAWLILLAGNMLMAACIWARYWQ